MNRTPEELVDALIAAVHDMDSERYPYPSQVKAVEDARQALLDRIG